MLGVGLIRIIFMFSLLNHHNLKKVYWNGYFFNGLYAVQLSFILSGFFMEMVYPKYKNIFSFYFSRITRIYPCYYLNLIVGYLLEKFNFVDYFPKFPKCFTFKTKMIIRFMDSTLLFKDLSQVICQNKQGQLLFVTKKKRNDYFLIFYTANSPTWTMGTEWNWYLIVPFLSKFNSFVLFVIYFISLTKRSYDYTYLKRNHDPFNVRYFPYELSHFIVGQLSYRVYIIILPFLQKIKKSYIPTFFVAFMFLFFDSIYSYLGQYFIIYLFAFFLPYLFFISKDSKIDRWLSERIYSIYIWHFLIRNILYKYYLPYLYFTKNFLIIQFSLCFVISIFLRNLYKIQ